MIAGICLAIILACFVAVVYAWAEDRRDTQKFSELIEFRLSQPSPVQRVNEMMSVLHPEWYNEDGSMTDSLREEIRQREQQLWDKSYYVQPSTEDNIDQPEPTELW